MKISLITRLVVTGLLISFSMLFTGCDNSSDPAPDIIISGFSPEKGFVGDEVIITGSNLPEVNFKLFINDVEVSEILENSASEIRFKVPRNASSGKIKIIYHDKVIESNIAFNVLNEHAIAGFEPVYGAPGTSVKISGSHFTTDASQVNIQFGETAATEIVDVQSNEIIVKVPQGASTGKITIEINELKAVSSDDFIITAPNQILPPFGQKHSATSVVFNNKIWIFSGQGNMKSDIWNSTDGKNWNLITENAEFAGRWLHSSVVYDNKIWIIGGLDEDFVRMDDVWFSEDGTNWQNATSSAGFNGRQHHASFIFKDKMWVIGGMNSQFEYQNDVWSSTDGISWTKELANAPFEPRSGHVALVYNDKIWIIGGNSKDVASDIDIYKNDVWSSTDGINWTEEVSNSSDFPAIMGHTGVVFNNEMYIIGGKKADESLSNEIWKSSNGINWTKLNTEVPGVTYHTSVVFDNKAWIIGGRYFDFRVSEIWFFE